MIKSKRIFYVNSRDRISGTDSDFNISIDMGPSPKYNRICALQAIPKSYYLIQAGFNTFSLTENGNTATVTFIPGNYSMSSFVALLPPLLNAA